MHELSQEARVQPARVLVRSHTTLPPCQSKGFGGAGRTDTPTRQSKGLKGGDPAECKHFDSQDQHGAQAPTQQEPVAA